MFPLLKPGHIPALASPRSGSTGRMSPEKDPTWKSHTPEAPDSGCGLISAFKGFPVFSFTIFHNLRVYELRRPKQSNISKAHHGVATVWLWCKLSEAKSNPGTCFFDTGMRQRQTEQNKLNHNTSANYCLVDTTQLNLNSENCLLFWLLWGAQICTLQQLVMPAIICASKKWSPSLRPGPRYQNPAVHLESLKSLNVESLTVIICKHINASLWCHNHMKGRLKHIGECSRSSRTKVWRFWLHIFVINIIILIEIVSLWPIFFFPVTLVHIHGTW